jgi:hypothetical protein
MKTETDSMFKYLDFDWFSPATNGAVGATSISFGVILKFINPATIIEGALLAIIGTILSVIVGYLVRKGLYKFDPKFFNKTKDSQNGQQQ